MMLTGNRGLLQRLRAVEAAQLAAGWVQLVTVLAAAGITVTDVVDRRVGLGIALFGLIAPYLQGRRTRADVWSQRSVDELAALAGQYPELADVIKDMIGRGINRTIIGQYLEATGGQHRTPAP